MKMRNSTDRSQVPALLRDLAGGTMKTNRISRVMISHLKGRVSRAALNVFGGCRLGCTDRDAAQEATLFIRVRAAKVGDCESSRLVQSVQLFPHGTAMLVVGEEHLPNGEVLNRR